MTGNRSADVTAPTLEEISAIVALEDRVLRNLHITYTYHRLSLALAALLGIEHANWCTFATWASKQAGHTIRGEDLPGRVHGLLLEHPTYDHVHQSIREMFVERFEVALSHRFHLDEHVSHLMESLSAAIAEGNLRVFAELAPLFARFLTLDDDVAIETFFSSLVPGPTAEGGQDLLRDAFFNYRLASVEPDRRRKMQLVLTANVQIGLHEQTRLQPNIASGLHTPVDVVEELVDRISHRFADHAKERLASHHHEHVAPACRPHARRLVDALTDVWCRTATDHIMRLGLPGLVLRLGHDIPHLRDERMFPEGLEELENEHLVALARTYDLSWNSTKGCGASDWTSLADRMHYIIDLFRSRHAERALHEPPFTTDQVHDISAGRVASGTL